MTPMMMTTNPYAPPTRESATVATDAPAGKSRARRVSFILAIVGFVSFWGVTALLASLQVRDPEHQVSAVPASVAFVVAVATHLVGIGIAFAAPRGRRLAPVLLNALSLALMIGLVLYGAKVAA
jgi:hypothetical protein